MEDLVIDYVQQVLQQAYTACEERQRGPKMKAGAEVKVKERDLLFVLRKDPRRYRRVQELLEVFREQKESVGQALPWWSWILFVPSFSAPQGCC